MGSTSPEIRKQKQEDAELSQRFYDPKILAMRFEDEHSVPYDHRNSLSTEECLAKYFPHISMRRAQKEIQIIRQAVRICEAKNGCVVGRAWRPFEWRICGLTPTDRKYLIVKRIWSIVRGLGKKEKNLREKYGAEFITDEDLNAYEEMIKNSMQKN